MRHAYESEQRAAFGFTPDVEPAVRSLLDQQRYESARVTWRLVLGDALQSLAGEPALSADVVFWDPYSPRAIPVLWSESAFAQLRRVCREGATVHTFSAATATRSAMLLAGFYVGLAPASGSKQKHATLAATRLSDLARPLDWTWLRDFPRVEAPQHEDSLSREARARLARLPQLGRV
jgi:queuine tRNA-ribosyltransferase